MRFLLIALALLSSYSFTQTLVVGNTTDSLYVKQSIRTATDLAYRMTRENIYEAEMKANGRIKYELHLGTGIRKIPDFYKMANLGIKMNLGRGKISQKESIQPLLESAKLNISEYNFSSTNELKSKISQIEKNLRDYDSRPWYNNIGIGITVPIFSEYKIESSDRNLSIREDWETGELDTISLSYNEETTTSNAYSTDYRYLFSKTAFVVYYDIGNLFVLNSGINYDREFTMGITIDISTPIANLGANFMKAIGRKANIDNTDFGYSYNRNTVYR